MKKKVFAIFVILILAGVVFNYRVTIRQAVEDWYRVKDLPSAVALSINQTIEQLNNQNLVQEKVTTTIKISSPQKKLMEINLAVPFMTQAPYGNWDALHEEACEEAAMIMFNAFYRGVNKISTEEAELAIQNLVAWMTERNYAVDVTASETVEVLKNYFGLTGAQVIYNITVDDIKKELAIGRPVIVPAAGKLLGNPNFRNGGPLYHMLVIRGYTKTGLFIVNDPGTKRGADYTYEVETLHNAIHDWVPGGDILTGKKAMIVVR